MLRQTDRQTGRQTNRQTEQTDRTDKIGLSFLYRISNRKNRYQLSGTCSF